MADHTAPGSQDAPEDVTMRKEAAVDQDHDEDQQDEESGEKQGKILDILSEEEENDPREVVHTHPGTKDADEMEEIRAFLAGKSTDNAWDCSESTGQSNSVGRSVCLEDPSGTDANTAAENSARIISLEEAARIFFRDKELLCPGEQLPLLNVVTKKDDGIDDKGNEDKSFSDEHLSSKPESSVGYPPCSLASGGPEVLESNRKEDVLNELFAAEELLSEVDVSKVLDESEENVTHLREEISLFISYLQYSSCTSIGPEECRDASIIIQKIHRATGTKPSHGEWPVPSTPVGWNAVMGTGSDVEMTTVPPSSPEPGVGPDARWHQERRPQQTRLAERISPYPSSAERTLRRRSLEHRLQQRRHVLGELDQTDRELVQLRQELPESLPDLPELHSLLQQLDQDDQDIDSLLCGQTGEHALPKVEAIFREMETYKDPLKEALKKLKNVFPSWQQKSSGRAQISRSNELGMKPDSSGQNPLQNLSPTELRGKVNSFCQVAMSKALAEDFPAQRRVWEQVTSDCDSLFAPACLPDQPAMVSLLRGMVAEVSRRLQSLQDPEAGGGWGRLCPPGLPERVELVTSEAERLRGQLEDPEQGPPGSRERRWARFLSVLPRLLFLCTLLPCT